MGTLLEGLQAWAPAGDWVLVPSGPTPQLFAASIYEDSDLNVKVTFWCWGGEPIRAFDLSMTVRVSLPFEGQGRGTWKT